MYDPTRDSDSLGLNSNLKSELPAGLGPDNASAHGQSTPKSML